MYYEGNSGSMSLACCIQAHSPFPVSPMSPRVFRLGHYGHHGGECGGRWCVR